ncbi:ORF63 [Duck adenovirus 3]|uniref:ORF63 n=3 Tax=Duck aviadenovirus B TaxID=1534553 RepID=A0A5F2P0L0_9ADEN|nr:ORF63 [Duck adenovirus 2]AYH52276.1 ORF63 [Duck adenovirus 3]QKW90001.1 ORF63 [Duck aviadenovirus B]AYH52308.1 ORF63 [Duck adenovirus 3]AYH52336.1 ORF63 [Duck adenovirus 3]
MVAVSKIVEAYSPMEPSAEGPMEAGIAEQERFYSASSGSP